MVQIGELVQSRYQVVKVIGEGGFGRIFEIVDKSDRHKRKVLKVLNLDRFSDEVSREKVINLFIREAEILKELSSSTNFHQLSI